MPSSALIANRLAIVGMVLVVFLFFIAIFGPYLTPYDFLSQDLMARNNRRPGSTGSAPTTSAATS